VPHETVLGGLVGLEGLVMFALYAAGILSALAVAFVLKRTVFRGAREPLLMELPAYRLPTALSLLVWFVFAPQCVSTLGIVRRETNSWFWPVVMFVYLTAPAYGASFITFRVASALLG